MEERRNPLGSGLGVSSDTLLRSRTPKLSCARVAIPSVRVSVFRQVLTSAGASSVYRPSRNPLGSGLGVSSCVGPLRGCRAQN